jgi:WD40 repeat protein
MVVGCDDDSIRLYDANTLAQTRKLPERELPGHSAAVTCASFSLDGRWIVSGSHDKTIRIWSVATGKEIVKLLGHSAPLTSVTFSSDGLRVLSSSQDTTARLWDVDRLAQTAENASEAAAEESGADLGEVLLLEFHSSEATVAEFSPDGRSILTAGVDGKAVLWPSERVPLSLRISNPNITYQPNDGPKRIDPLAVLCQPGSLDLDGAKLEVKFANDEGNTKRLLIDPSDGMFEIQGSKLHYRPTKNTQIEIGSYEALAGSGMQITFNKTAGHAGAEQLVRHIAYQSESQTQSEMDVKSQVIIQVRNQYGHSGNAEPESILISHLDSH